MNIDFLETLSIEHSLQQRLPMQTTDDEIYVRDRFYWIVDDFCNEYFDFKNEKVDTDLVLEDMFSSAKSDIGNMNSTNLYDFKIALAGIFITAAKKFDYSLNVTPSFFRKQFLAKIDRRSRIQHDTILEYAEILSYALTNEGIDKYKAMKIVEAGFLAAETTQYTVTPVEFLAEVIGGIIEECEDVIDHGIHGQNLIVKDFAYFLSQIIVNADIDKNKVMKIIEAGCIVAEFTPPYNCCSKEDFLMNVLERIASSGKQTFHYS